VKRQAVLGIVLAAACVLLPAASCSRDGDPPKAGMPGGKPVPVLAAYAARQSVPVEISTFGAVQANSTVTIKAQVTGVLNKVCFRKGQEVTKGQLLFEIDPLPFKATIRQLEANEARDQAQLDNARKELVRQTELLKKGVASQADFDKAQTDVAAFEAVVKADQAAVDNAVLLLNYCTITSPIDGRAGDLMVDQGNLVKANDVGLVTVDQVRPIEVYFSIPQRDLPAVRKYMAAGPLKVRASIPGTGEPPEEGELTFIDNSVDSSTNTIRLGSTFPNEQERLWPGLYVDVVMTLTVQKDVTVVPSQAVQNGRDGPYVFVIVSDDSGQIIAQVRPVKVGRSGDGIAIIASGVSPGEQVVTDGQVRLLPGAKVVIRKDLLDTAPASGPASRPASKTVAASQPASRRS
jgi:multidrug efflux system membrane fusion protein